MLGHDRFHPTWDPGGCGHARDRGLQWQAGLHQTHDRAHGVGDVESSRQPHRGVGLHPTRSDDPKRASGGSQSHVHGLPIGLHGRGGVGVGEALHGERGHRDLAVCLDHVHERTAEPVVGVDHRDVAVLRGEQLCLGLEVVAKVTVEVEMVLGQVRENRNVEVGALGPSQGQGVAGDLHGRAGHTALTHQREQAVQVGGLGCGQRGLDTLVPDPHLDRSDQSGAHPGPAQPGLEQVADAGLAAGAGRTHKEELLDGVVEHPGGGTPQGGAHVRHDEYRKPGGLGPVGTCRVGHDRGRPRPGRLVGELGAVHAHAR